MRRLAVSGVTSSGTTYISLEDVRVPINHLLGEENQGMRYIMTNFNHERLVVATGATRQARVALTAAFEYVLKREAFGKPLVEQPVVRHRLAKAGALLESQTAWVEQFAYMMTKMPHEQAGILLGGPTALLKAHAGMVFKECADTAVLLFGGNGYTKAGQGQLVESEFYIRPPSCFGYRTDDAADSVVPGGHGREDPRRVRGCPARLGCAAAGQDLQDANPNSGG
jgi:acyl-CoA dehydrogenase